MKGFVLGAALAALFGACASRTSVEPERASMLITHANVRTLDSARPQATAIALVDGRVAAVGDEASARAALPSNAPALDLGGATVLPGLVDAHAHLLGLGEAMAGVNLVGTYTYAEVVERTRAAAANLPAGGWVIGRGWNQNDWPEREFPSHLALSAAVPNRPAMLERIDGHAVLVNAQAMTLAGLSRRTPDPDGGRIVRDAHGEPTGVLVDNAMALVARLVPAPTDSQLDELLLDATKRCAALGLTGVHDMGVDGATWKALNRLAASHRLPIRVYALARGADPHLEDLLAGGPWIDLYQGRLSLRGVKFFLDGALGSRGAALFEPYGDDPGNRGLDLEETETFERQVEALMRRHFQVATHAIGDRANAHALDAYEKAMTATGASDARPRVEHAQILRVADIPRFAKLGVIASMQPTHATSDMPWAERRLGKARLAGAYAWRSILSSGAHLAFGSDFPVEDVNPLLGLYSAVTRTDHQGKPDGGWTPDQRLTMDEAVRAFTEGAAYASFMEHDAGRIAPGMRADFTVLNRDPFDVPPAELLRARAVLTIVAGEVVFDGRRQ